MQAITEPKRNRNTLYIVLLVILIFFCCAVACLMTYYFRTMTGGNASVAAIEVICLILSVPVFLSVLRYKGAMEITEVFMMMMVVNAVYLGADITAHLVDGKPELFILHFIAAMLCRLCPVPLAVLFWAFIIRWSREEGSSTERKRSYLLHIAADIDILFILGNIPGRYIFEISKDRGLFAPGPLISLSIVFPIIALFVFLKMVINSRISISDRITLLVYPVLPVVVSFFQVVMKGPTFVPIATFFSLILIYTNLFVRRGRESIARQHDLALSRLQVLQMQINPHFLYNTLASIGSLCDSDPQAAQEMVYMLSDYLHDNFTDIHAPAMISFSDELDHLKSYYSIQKVRFPEISLEYELSATEFSVPAMTLQPLVENAIRHGLRKLRGRDGVITITSAQTDDAFVVCVKDNGTGFAQDAEETDEHEHIGIANVRKRLEMLCGGSLEVESVPSEGTLCRIIIPKE